MPEDSHDERRQFERFPVDFEVLVYTHQDNHSEFIETANIENISGGGISFFTNNPDQYSIGQQLEVAIHLPDCETYEAFMKSIATVVRIGAASQNGQAIIGLQFHDELDFESKPKAN